MTEAFEIGISLALADGVSEGIAKAQRDADAVTHAVGAGALSVQRLQKAGIAALTVMHSVRNLAGSLNPGQLARGKVAPGSEAGSGERSDAGVAPVERPQVVAAAPMSPSPVPALISGAAGSAPEALRATDIKANLPEPPIAEPRMEVLHSFRLDRVPLPVRQQPVVSVADQPGQAGAEPGAPLASPVGEQPASGSMVRAEQVGAERSVPLAPPVRPQAAAGMPGQLEQAAATRGPPVAAPFAPAAGASARGAAYFAPAMACSLDAEPSGLRLDVFGSRRPDVVSGADFEGADRGAGPPAVQPAAWSNVPPAASFAPVLTEAPQRRLAAQDSAAPGNEVVQEAGENSGGAAGGAGGSIQGDVFLDGVLVGRWMSRYLSREAGRASAGPTGFDQRRNALLPGATVGG
jgi:hypothetical protein